MPAPSLRPLLALGAIGLLASGCAHVQHSIQHTTNQIARAIAPSGAKPSYWEGDSVPGRSRIVVSISEQRAYFYKGKKLVGESVISTGRKGFDTPPGHYHVIQKDRDHVSNEYGDYVSNEMVVLKRNADVNRDPMPAGAILVGAPMPYFLRFTQGYGMHAGLVPRYRASHGCIRLPRDMAAHFFQAAEIGTPVTVKE